jgi:phytol kinase
MPQFIHFIWLTASGFAVFALAEWLYRSQKFHVEITRNVVHIFIGLSSLLYPVLFNDQWWVLLICAIFQFVLAITLQRGNLRCVHAVKRKTYGSLLYPMTIFLVYMAWFYSGSRHDNVSQSYAYFILPILVLTLCDPLATLVGTKFPIYRFDYTKKSLGGSMAFWNLTFFISCFVLLSSHLFYGKDFIWVSIFIATTATILELYSKKGFDNLSIPVVVLVSMFIVEYFF